mgnify:CR=1 FL=1
MNALSALSDVRVVPIHSVDHSRNILGSTQKIKSPSLLNLAIRNAEVNKGQLGPPINHYNPVCMKQNIYVVSISDTIFEQPPTQYDSHILFVASSGLIL